MAQDLSGQSSTGSARDVLLGSGDLGAYLANGASSARTIGESVPTFDASSFNAQLMDILTRFQQGGYAAIAPLRQQQLNAQQGQANILSAPVDQSLIGASPSQQSQVRGASVNAVDPTIQGAQFAQTGLRDIIGQASSFVTNLQAQKEQARQQAFDTLTKLTTNLDSSSLDQWIQANPKQVNDIESVAGLKGYLQQSVSAKKRSEAVKEKLDTQWVDLPDGSKALMNMQTGNIIKQAPVSGAIGSSVGGLPISVISPETGLSENALKNVDPGVAQIVKQLVNYRIPLPTGFALRSPYWQNILQLASLYDPSFDATQYNVRLKLRQDFTSGKTANIIRSLNTAIGHLESFKKSADALGNVSLTALNRLKNAGGTQLGSPTVKNFDVVKNAVAGEMATVFKQTAGTDQEIQGWKDTVNASESPEQLRGAIDKMLELMNSRMQALQNQYEVGLGKPKNFRFLSDKSQKILTDFGIDINSWDPTVGEAQQTQGGTVIMTGPKGSFNVPSDQVDIFKQNGYTQ